MAPTPPQQQKQPIDSDAVARAEKERADKLALKVKELEGQLAKRPDAPQKPPLPAEIVPGTHTYRLTQPQYREGKYYQAGEHITVTDEAPGKTWVEVKEKAAIELVDVVAPEGEKTQRAADQQV